MKAYDVIQKIIHTIVFILFAFLTTIVLIQIICRLFHISQTWIDEISKFTFVWLTYIGGCITVSRGMNITFDLILEGAKGKKFTVLYHLSHLQRHSRGAHNTERLAEPHSEIAHDRPQYGACQRGDSHRFLPDDLRTGRVLAPPSERASGRGGKGTGRKGG